MSVLESEHLNRYLSHLDVTTKMLRIKGTPNLDVKLREDIHDIVDASMSYLQSFASSVVIDVVAAHGSAMFALNGILAPLLDAVGVEKEDVLIDFYFHQILLGVVREEKPSVSVDDYRDADEDSSIWILLAFRMWCWFLLRDFSEDIRLVPSDLKGSRMPVFIG